MCFRGGAASGAGPCHRDHQQHLPISEQLQNLDGLRWHIGVLDVGTVAVVIPNHVARVQDRQLEDGVDGHEAHEAHEPNVSIVVHECNLAPFVSQNEGDEPANDAPHIEDALEQRYVWTLSPWQGVQRHDSSLPHPEQSCSDSEDGAGDNGEGLVLVVVVVKERAGVEDVGWATSEEGEVGAEDVVDATTQDAEDGEGGVKGDVRIIGGGGIHLPTSPHPGKGIEHAWTSEVYQANQTDLN